MTIRDRADEIAQAWTAVAAAWDAHAEEIEEQSRPMTELLLARVAVAPGDRLLELAAGPGSLGATWSALVGPTGVAIVSDLSPAMVTAATRRNASFDNVSTAVRDLGAIDEPDGSFDVVVCRMGLPFTDDPARALREIRRVLRPGGRCTVLTWAGPEHNPWLTCVAAAVSSAGLLDASAQPQAGFALTEAEATKTLVDAAGFVDVRMDEVALCFEAESVDAHFDRIAALAAPLSDALAAATADQLQSVRRAAAMFAAPYTKHGAVELPGLALVVSGRRPTMP